MALPFTLTNMQFPDQAYYCGPFKSSAGAFYICAVSESDKTLVRVIKATDPESSWATQDDANAPTTGNEQRSVWAVQNGDDLHVIHAQTGADGFVLYSIFHMATDLWDGTIVDEVILDRTTTGISNEASCSLGLRSDGDVIALYYGDTDKLMGTDFARIDYARREGGSWTADIAVDNAGEEDWTSTVVVMGSNDRAHFFFKNDELDDAYQRTLVNSGNALETFPSAGDTTARGFRHIFRAGMSYDDGGTQRIRCPYMDSNSKISYAEFNSVDAPGAFTINADVSDTTVKSQTDDILMGTISLDTDEFLLYVDDSTSDIFLDENNGTDIEVLDAITGSSLSFNIYIREALVVGYIYEDGSTIEKYNELLIGAPGSEAIYNRILTQGF